MVKHAEGIFVQGPQSRLHELVRAFKIFFEIIRGLRILHFIGPCVTIFGSARFSEFHPFYKQTRALAGAIGRAGFTIMTGGGPGAMEAANRGAQDVGAKSVGVGIRLPKEQNPNPFIDVWIEFKYFFIRKFMLAKYSTAFVGAPGGFGTLDELYEVLTLIQTGKCEPFPVVLFGCDYWEPMLEFLRERLLAQGAISASDLELFLVTDDAEEAVRYILDGSMKIYQTTRGPKLKRRWYLLEKA